jgi:rhodanese-related sulfurtransferase
MFRTRLATIVWLAVIGAGGFLAGCQAAQPAQPMTAQAYVAAAKKVVVELPPQQAAKVIAETPDLFLLDVQLVGEYDLAHIKGAVLIPRGYLEFKIAKNDLFPAINHGRVPRLDQPILVYCTLGSRSLLAARTLVDMGYTNVHSVQGGLKAWTEAGLPVEKSYPSAKVPPATGPTGK